MQWSPKNYVDCLTEKTETYISSGSVIFLVAKKTVQGRARRKGGQRGDAKDSAGSSTAGKIMQDLKKIPLLTRQEETELGKRLVAARERLKNAKAKGKSISGEKAEFEAIRNRLVEHNLRLVPYFLRKSFFGMREPIDSIARRLAFSAGWDFNEIYLDMVQAGNHGLIFAATLWEPGESRFSTYAGSWVAQAVLRELETNFALSVKSHAHTKLKKARAALAKKGGTATLREELDFELRNRQYTNAKRVASLDRPLRDRQGEKSGSTLLDIIPDSGAETMEHKILLQKAGEKSREALGELEKINSKMREIIENRYLSEKPLSKSRLAKALGISERTVEKLESKGIRILRARLKEFKGLRS